MAAGVRNLGEWGKTPDGQVIERWEMDNGNGLRAEVLNLGGILLRLQMPDCTGQMGDIVLSPRSAEVIFGAGWPYLGALIGRFGNRIGYGRFTVDGRTYSLAPNDVPHSLHGGAVGYDRRLWDVSPAYSLEGVALRLALVDADGVEGYPGTVQLSVIYTLTSDGIWRIDYHATTDKATPINLTQHAYFNLKDAGKSSVMDHELSINAANYTPSDAALIPTGTIEPIAGTPFDFLRPKAIGRDLAKLTNRPAGYDHNYVINDFDGHLQLIAEIQERTTGRAMQVWTTEPGVQLYTGNFLDGSLISPDGFPYQQYAGFCLETQHYPDSPNQPTFPNTILRPEETYRQTTEYRFAVLE